MCTPRKGSSSSAGNDYVGDLGVSTSTSLPVDRKTLSSNINYIPIIPIEDVEFKVITRGAPPQGGGEVLLKMPIVHSNLTVRDMSSD